MMTAATQIMSDKEFHAKLTHIREQHEALQQKADAYLDQEMARLFVTSGWTQQRIADEVGKSQNWVCYQLCFGRFLTFITTVINLKTPTNLTERRFRGYWEKTGDESSKEATRFRKVAEMMETDLILSRPSTEAGKQLVAQFGDWKYRTAEEMAESLDVELQSVKNALQRMKANNAYATKCEAKQIGKHTKYRLKKMPTGSLKVTAASLAEDLLPIVKQGIELTQNAHAAEYSRLGTAGVFVRIQQLLEQILGKDS